MNRKTTQTFSRVWNLLTGTAPSRTDADKVSSVSSNPKLRILICGMGYFFLLFLSPTLLRAQDQGFGDVILTGGTVVHAGTPAREWAWIQFMATDATLLKNRRMDLYLKPGDISSTSNFVLKGSAMLTTDPRTIEMLLKRGEMLGDNLTELDTVVDNLFADATPTASLTLPEKTAALISGSLQDPELYKNLVFIGRAHPAVSMMIGQGFACPIFATGFSTLEIRDHANDEIMGRITLQAGAPTILPAPGSIHRVREKSPKGHLNIRFRWDISPDLKRLSILQFGFNIYRMTELFAEDEGYNINPPDSGNIAELVESNAEVVKINRKPILVDPSADSNIWFIVDDNNRYTGGTPLVDGDSYYYFVSAIDLLGRDGDLSDGCLLKACDRMAPIVPHGVRTRSVTDYISGVHTQWVEISWIHDTNDIDTARYYVYRFKDVAEMQSNAVFAVSNRISGAIVPALDATRMFFEDHSLSSNDWGITYTYTVRAEDNASCGHNLSGNSPPAFGVFRKWVGPPLTSGALVSIQVEAPTCTFSRVSSPSLPQQYNVELACTRSSANSGIAWVEFFCRPGFYPSSESVSNAASLGSYYFGPDGVEVSKAFFLPFPSEEESEYTFYCQIGTQNGKLSNIAVHEQRIIFNKRIEFSATNSLLSKSSAVDDGPHIWDWPSPVFPTITIPATPGAKTYRLYKRVDDGEYTLLSQGELDKMAGAVIRDVLAGSVNATRVCYFYQLLDENGNVGPTIPIKCFTTQPRADLPTPILAPVESTGTAINKPGLKLRWFCPPPGIERFEIAVAPDELPLSKTFGTNDYPLYQGKTNELSVTIHNVTNRLNFGFYRTGRVGATFGAPDSPLFVLENPADLKRKYTFMVRAISIAGTTGPWSNIQTIHWNNSDLNPETDPVPWPTHGLPVVQNAPFHTKLEAVYLSGDNYTYTPGGDCVGIRIGEIPNDHDISFNGYTVHLDYICDPMTFLYHNSAYTNQNVMPCVLYRYQLTNELYRSVSGDISQVSPMLENIACGTGLSETILYETFVTVTRIQDDNYAPWDIFLEDTQPVVHGARYQYLLLRFNKSTKEIDRIIPAGTVTIP